VDFANATVWIEAAWDLAEIRLCVIDDGAGFPPEVLSRLGDPFLRRRTRQSTSPQRAGYEGMGLGLFIAKTLLERSGARVSFRNSSDPFLTASEKGAKRGAVVEVVWPKSRICLSEEERNTPLGQNKPFSP
ncbi:MAG: ATP-binding protein, partial [Rhodobacteraceae bacterium]|nr:ATP-binding protein [Paracoccaceae bacterium]